MVWPTGNRGGRESGIGKRRARARTRGPAGARRIGPGEYSIERRDRPDHPASRITLGDLLELGEVTCTDLEAAVISAADLAQRLGISGRDQGPRSLRSDARATYLLGRAASAESAAMRHYGKSWSAGLSQHWRK
jgi:hypothetical protein